jgi:hypothetical protein
VYDKSRSWQLTVDCGNAVTGLGEIAQLIRTRGIMHGKGYFRAILPKKNGGVLSIDFSSMLPARNW